MGRLAKGQFPKATAMVTVRLDVDELATLQRVMQKHGFESISDTLRFALRFVDSSVVGVSAQVEK